MKIKYGTDGGPSGATPGWSFEEIEKLVERRYISKEKHPALDLHIYNYTSKTQYEARWTPETLACRGLILNGRGSVVARPFEKFFNLGEPFAPPLPEGERFEVFEKLDGSLIIATVWRGCRVVATRGSFVSIQAQIAERMLSKRYERAASAMEEEKTYLFELIHPESRVVVDYGDEETLHLLAVIDGVSGADLPLAGNLLPGIPVVRSYPECANLSALPERENAEGYVARFESGLRLKVKHPEYVRVHRLVSHATPKHVWEYLKEGRDPLANLEGIPDEVYGALETTATDLRARYSVMEATVRELYGAMDEELGEDATRKEKAFWIQNHDRSLQPVLFAMLSGKDPSRIIWRILKPAGEGEEGS